MIQVNRINLLGVCGCGIGWWGRGGGGGDSDVVVYTFSASHIHSIQRYEGGVEESATPPYVR